MNITIIRTKKTRWAQDGELWISGEKVCDTTENRDQHLTAGTYQLEMIRDPTPGKYGQMTPYIVGAHEPSGSITYGNGIRKLMKPDILVGTLQCSGLCINGYDTFRHLLERMTKARSRNPKEQFTLTILD